MTKKTDIVIPDDIYTLFLKPFAKKLKLKHIPRKPLTLLKAIFQKLAQKQTKFNVPRLESILENVEQLIKPVTLVLKIIAEVLRPIFSVIPPQYLMIIIAIFLAIFLIYPAFFMGVFVFYKLEDWIKVPFVLTQQKIDLIPSTLRRLQYSIKRVTTKKITLQIKDWNKVPEKDRLAYMYEADAITRAKIISLNLILKQYPELTIEEIIERLHEASETLHPYLRDAFLTIDFTEEITLKQTTYQGWRKVLPPILHSIANGLKAVFKLVQSVIDSLDPEGNIVEGTLNILTGENIRKFFLGGALGPFLIGLEAAKLSEAKK